MRRARWKRKERRFWHSRKPHASMEGRSADLMRGRMDFLLFPRFAPSPLRAGQRAGLPAVGGQACPNVPGQARSAGREARDDASKQQNNLVGTRRCGRAPPQGTLSDAAGRRLAIYGSTGSGQPPYFGRNLPHRQILALAFSFLFGPCTARFSFLWQDREKRNGGCSPKARRAPAGLSSRPRGPDSAGIQFPRPGPESGNPPPCTTRSQSSTAARRPSSSNFTETIWFRVFWAMSSIRILEG